MAFEIAAGKPAPAVILILDVQQDFRACRLGLSIDKIGVRDEAFSFLRNAQFESSPRSAPGVNQCVHCETRPLPLAAPTRITSASYAKRRPGESLRR